MVFLNVDLEERIGPNLLGIAPVEPTRELALPDDLRSQLQATYDRIPSVRCGCGHPGWCCELTPEEMASDFATMYPLYKVEYLNIVDYVEDKFDKSRQEHLLGLTEERPERCPFLTDSGACSIHPVRPLACRTYGVLKNKEVEDAALEAEGQIPDGWIRRFIFRERDTVCRHTEVLDRDKVQSHARAMIAFEYERELIQLGRQVESLGGERRSHLERVTGKWEVESWTWGGFNALLGRSTSWLARHFEGYWKNSSLAE